jgi:amino acid adenylation domain-containing protein
VSDLANIFLATAERFPERPALVVGDRVLDYRTLASRAWTLASAIRRAAATRTPLVAVLAARSESAYTGVLGALLSGNGYVPLSPGFPPARVRRSLDRSDCRVLIVGAEGAGSLDEILADAAHALHVIAAPGVAIESLRAAHPRHRFETIGEPHPDDGPIAAPDVAADAAAYLLFTSGTTGEPKGVAVSQRNVSSYVHHVGERFDVSEHDRLSQHFDLTFDLSVHDLFVAWSRGACVCCVPEASQMAPAKFIREQSLTLWFSVPSAIGFMRRLGLLRPGSLPSLRGSLFCGEPLVGDAVVAWQQAAPHSFIENLYGPTEATIALTGYRWQGESSLEQCVNGIVPIGQPFEGQLADVVGEHGKRCAAGEPGELVLSGSQLTSGYWQDPVQTQERFVSLPDLGAGTWYRTGDLARRDEHGCLYFLGRVDDQIKIRGYRVELLEVDHALRQAAEAPEAISVAWPIADGSADGTVAVLQANASDVPAQEILKRCAARLPDYMVPRKLCVVDSLPLNVNGKIDRKKLTNMLEEGLL